MHCIRSGINATKISDLMKTSTLLFPAAEKSKKVQIQPGGASSSGSVVYRRQSCQPSAASSWSTPSDNSFQFGFDLPERAPEELKRTTEEVNRVAHAQEQPASNIPSTQEGQWEIPHFHTGMQGPGFAFNFIIPDGPLPPAAADPGLEDAAEAATERDSPSRRAMETLESSLSPEPSKLDAGSGADRRDDGNPSPEVAQEGTETMPAS